MSTRDGWPGRRNAPLVHAGDLVPIMDALNRGYTEDCAVQVQSMILAHDTRAIAAYMDENEDQMCRTVSNPFAQYTQTGRNFLGAIHALENTDLLDMFATRDLPALVDGLRNRGTWFRRPVEAPSFIERYDTDTIFTAAAERADVAFFEVLLGHMGAFPDELIQAKGHGGRTAEQWATTRSIQNIFTAQRCIPNDERRRILESRIRRHPAMRKRRQFQSACVFMCCVRAQQNAKPSRDNTSSTTDAIDMSRVPNEVALRIADFAFWL